MYCFIFLASFASLFTINKAYVKHGEEKTKDPIGRLKTRHNGLMPRSFMSEKASSCSFSRSFNEMFVSLNSIELMK